LLDDARQSLDQCELFLQRDLRIRQRVDRLVQRTLTCGFRFVVFAIRLRERTDRIGLRFGRGSNDVILWVYLLPV
jgi:hypothetical protein